MASLSRPEVAGAVYGVLELAFIRDRDGRTRPDRALAQPPLQLSRVRYDDPQRPEIAVHTLLMLGGILAGDQHSLHVELAEQTTARMVMAAATQVLSMPHGHAKQSLTLRLHAGSTLEWLAAPTILFADAAFEQHTTIVLGRNARLTFLDILVPGRLARGEMHAYRHYQSSLEIYDESENLLVCERSNLAPSRRATAVPGVLGQTAVVGSLFLLGHSLPAAQLAAKMHDPTTLIGVTTLPNQAGVLVRTLGHSASEVRGRLMELISSPSHMPALAPPH